MVDRIKEEKDENELVYAVVEEDNPKSRARFLHRNQLLLYGQFLAFTERKSYRKQKQQQHNKNNKNNGNIAIRKQLTFGTAEMTVMQIFRNSFQLSTPTVKK